jgi:hypothetical protein
MKCVKRVVTYVASALVGVVGGMVYAAEMTHRGRAADIGKLSRTVIEEEVDNMRATGCGFDELIERLVARTPNGATL